MSKSLLLTLVLLAPALSAQAEDLLLRTGHARLTIDSERASLIQWEVCYQPCDGIENRAYRQKLIMVDRPVEITSSDSREQWQLLRHGSNWAEFLLRKAQNDANPPLTLRVELIREYQVRLDVNGDPADINLIVRLHPPVAFHREPAYGFAGSQEFIAPVAVDDGETIPADQLIIDSDSPKSSKTPNNLEADWVGFRNRFWALLAAHPQSAWRYTVQPQMEGLWESPIEPGAPLVIYAGPTAPDVLRAVDPELSQIMFDDMWFWMRWLCFAFLYILNAMASLFDGSWGVAIIALSAVVKIMMEPLTRVAERWQGHVNRIQSDLQPRIDAIKRESKGEEQAIRILAAHKELGVTPFYTFRSSFGFLIQIPVFIAAFNVLSEAAGLNGADFLWIQDLALPDNFISLPFVIPFFGDHLNLLPILMTGITVVGAWLHRDKTLSGALRARRRRTLFWMAALFFVLFYTFPAGMVLYWTSNVLLHSVRDAIQHRRRAIAIV